MFKDLQEDIDNAKVLTEEDLSEVNSTEFESGREIKEGDKAVFGLFVKNANGDHLTHEGLKINLGSVPDYEINLSVGTFHPDEIGELYEAVAPEKLGGENYLIFRKPEEGECKCGGECGCGGNDG